LIEILEDREKRFFKILNLYKKYNYPILCGKINYPGINKNTLEAEYAFNVLYSLLMNLFKDYIIYHEVDKGYDGKSVLMVLRLDKFEAKRMSINIENEHELGRIFDIDIYEKENPVSRTELGFKERECIICKKSARECSRQKKHALDEVLEEINYLINRYKIKEELKLNEFSLAVGRILTEGMLLEVISHPSPGLVSPFSNGSHNDMDYNLFLKSTAILSIYMPYFVQAGFEYKDNILENIRKIGLIAERDMFRQTNGVNTQKGLIFLCGVVGASCGKAKRLRLPINRYVISKIIKDMTKGIVDRELKNINLNKKLSNGERLYLKYRVEGIRGEVERGLPTVLKYGLPFFEDALSSGLSINDSLIHSLIYIISKVEDTTVLNRKGLSGISFMKSMANNAIFLGGMKTKAGREYIEFMDKAFIKNNISPGGAADLLAITYIIYKLEKEKWGIKHE